MNDSVIIAALGTLLTIAVILLKVVTDHRAGLVAKYKQDNLELKKRAEEAEANNEALLEVNAKLVEAYAELEQKHAKLKEAKPPKAGRAGRGWVTDF